VYVAKLSIEDIRKRFELSREFNEIFDAFEQALEQKIHDMELYRRLFWNNVLTPDELCMFGEKLVKEFPTLAYDVYMWLASVFGVTYAMYDNYELAFEYYTKASRARPSCPDPYLEASDCYEPDLNIPSLTSIIDFLKIGLQHTETPKPFYEKLAHFYEVSGNDEMSKYYRRQSDEASGASSGQ
jgi:tetratricopeptide (TPR) repeat protein